MSSSNPNKRTNENNDEENKNTKFQKTNDPNIPTSYSIKEINGKLYISKNFISHKIGSRIVTSLITGENTAAVVAIKYGVESKN